MKLKCAGQILQILAQKVTSPHIIGQKQEKMVKFFSEQISGNLILIVPAKKLTIALHRYLLPVDHGAEKQTVMISIVQLL